MTCARDSRQVTLRRACGTAVRGVRWCLALVMVDRLNNLSVWPLSVTAAYVVLLVGCGPHVGLEQMRLTNAAFDMKTYRTQAPVISEPLTLEDALNYAARYNIDVWIAAHETRFEQELATQSTLKMLPSLMARSGYSDRSKFDASSSQSLESGEESLEPSYSSERYVRTFEIAATWNLLDFGISYLRARQQGNRVIVAMERERRAQQNLALQVTRAYWQAVTARVSAREAEQINEQVTATLKKIRQEVEEKSISEVDGLRRETSLLERQEELLRYERGYMKAKTELASLIGLSLGTALTLADVDFDEPVDEAAHDIEELEAEALHSRPELFEKDLEEAMSRDEAHAALAQMFPSPAMFLQLNYSSNRFYVFDHWNTVGLRASWDLLAIPQQIKQVDAIKLQTELIAKRRVAISVAILTQLHLTLIDREEALERRAFTKLVSEKSDMLLEAVESEVEEGKSHAGEAIDHKMKSLKARAKFLSAHDHLMNSNARLLNTLGRDLPCRAREAKDSGASEASSAAAGSAVNVANKR